jgi:copper(I)-binding protein
MTARTAGRLAALALALLAVVGCTYYPTVQETGGVRLQPEEGRLVRLADANAVVFYVHLNSTGKYGDTLVGATAPIARQAELISASGTRLGQLEIPGEAVVKFAENGPRIVLSDLTRTVTPGEVVIVTLHFKKSGALGIISVVQ